MKTCTKCGTAKEASEFYGATRSACKECMKAAVRERRQRAAERLCPHCVPLGRHWLEEGETCERWDG